MFVSPNGEVFVQYRRRVAGSNATARPFQERVHWLSWVPKAASEIPLISKDHAATNTAMNVIRSSRLVIGYPRHVAASSHRRACAPPAARPRDGSARDDQEDGRG